MNHNLLYAGINAKLAEIVERTSPIWSEGWEKLEPTAPDDERLAVYQAIRDAASLPEAAGLYLVAWQIDAMTSEIAESALRMGSPDLLHREAHSPQSPSSVEKTGLVH